MKRRILFVTAEMGYGGAEKVLGFLANCCSQQGHDVYLLAYENNCIIRTLLPSVKHVASSYRKPPIFGVRRLMQIFQVRKVILDLNPDLVISFLTYPNMISIIASIGSRVPVIISERGDPNALKGPFAALRDFVYRYADAYVFQLNGARNYYSRTIQDRSVVIPNPVIWENVPAEWSGERDDLVVNVARFEIKQKRQDILLEAFSKISRKYPNLRLVLYGDGPDEGIIRQLIQKYELSEKVLLGGVVKDIFSAIRNAKLFVLSSDYEGIPNALIEAMSVGLPCVSTNCSPGGAAELLTHLESGIIVEVGSSDAIGEAIDYMLSNPDDAERMGQNAKWALKDLAPDVILSKWESLFERVIKTRRGNQ